MRSLPALLVLAACSGDGDGHADTTETGADCGTWIPALEITAPAEGETVTGPDVTVTLSVTDFLWQEATAAHTPAPDPLGWLSARAFAHEPNDCPGGYAVLALDGAEVASGAADSFTLSDVAAGEHTLSVELLYADGDELFPPVEEEVGFTVQ